MDMTQGNYATSTDQSFKKVKFRLKKLRKKRCFNANRHIGNGINLSK